MRSQARVRANEKALERFMARGKAEQPGINIVGKLGQPRDQLFGNPIGKVLLVVNGTQVVKGKNSDRRVLGERKCAFIAEKGVP